LQEDLWHAEVDDGQISQVINNLVINADQAMPAGGVIKICAKNMNLTEKNQLRLNPGSYICISIADQGVGIIEEHIPRIFDPYFTTKQRGSGLGLSTVYSIIKNHGGLVTVDSVLGKGTIFSIFLSALPDQPTETNDITLDSISGTGKILVMDDEIIVRKAAAKMLRRLGYMVDFAEDGGRAIEMYRQAKESGAPYDVVMVDLTIAGGMGGETAIKKLKEFDADVKAIVSSGYSNDPIMADYTAYGFCGVVAKPFKIVTLSNILNKILCKK